MNKVLKYGLISLAGLIGLVLIAIAVIAATFNPNDYKPLIVKMVQEKKQRTLNIEGDIKLAFWPKLGADLGKVSISERHSDKDSGDKEFASMQSAKVFVSVMPLLRKELVVDTVKIDGVKANIVRFKDGTTNFDDLLSKEESEEIKFDIDGVVVSNAAVTLSDEMGGRHFNISNATIKTGHIAKNQPIDLDAEFHIKGDNPVLDTQAHIKGTLLADAEHQQYGAKGLDLALLGNVAALKKLDLKLSGDLDAKPQTLEFTVNGLKLAASADVQGKRVAVELDAPNLSAQKDEVSGKQANLSITQTQGEDTVSAKLTIANLKGSPKAFQSSGITGEISGKQGVRTLAGKFSSPFSGNLENMIFDLPKLAGNVDVKDPSLPGGAMKASFNINSHTNVKKELANVALDANIDGSKLKGNVAVAGFAKPNVKFDLNADQLDLNKILGKQDKPTSNKPADLSALKNLLAQGSLNVGSMAYDKYRIANLALTLKADGQALSVNPLSAKVDDSQIKGSVGISHFDKPLYTFDLDIDRVDADRYVAKQDSSKPKDDKPLDLSALKTLNAAGSLRIGSLKYDKIQSSNIRIDLKADSEKLSLNPFSAKIDDSQVKAVLGITQFQNPQFTFNVDIDRLDADRYITKSDQPVAKNSGDTPLDLSALKTLRANGEAKVGWLKLANIKTENVNVGLKAEGGLVNLSPFAANLYRGSMAGTLKLDARTTPNILLKQDMKGISVGPLLIDAIQNDMLDGKGNLILDVTTQGNTVNALKKALNGTTAMVLADGAIKGIDIAGTIREFKSKVNFTKPQSSLGADQKKRTEFSEMTASFNIKNGVAHNDDLSMKAPLFRIIGSGDIDIGNSTINYLAKPTVVASLKGQGGSDLDSLSGLTIPVKITGTFDAPKYDMDFAGMGAALAKSKLLEKVGGSKGEAVQQLLGGDKAGALGGLLSGKEKTPAATPTTPTDTATLPEPAKPSTPEDKVKKKLNKLLGF
ncbi:MAG: AsmA family protein [Methylophilaceae bacterium]